MATGVDSGVDVAALVNLAVGIVATGKDGATGVGVGADVCTGVNADPGVYVTVDVDNITGVYVCVLACASTRVFVCLCMCACAREHMCVCACVCVCVRVSVSVCMSLCLCADKQLLSSVHCLNQRDNPTDLCPFRLSQNVTRPSVLMVITHACTAPFTFVPKHT